MEAVKSEQSDIWHLCGARGCGADPNGEGISGNWAVIRDHVSRDTGTRCGNCNWPP